MAAALPLPPRPPQQPRKLTANEIAYEAIQAGFTGQDVVTATAIALAESGGNPQALNNNPATRDLSYGLWQINMFGDLGPARRAQFGIDTNEKLFGTAVNAKAAKIIHNGQGFAAWSVYKTGAYRAFIVIADAGAKDPKPTNVISGEAQGGVETQIDLLKPFQDLINWILKQPVIWRAGAFVGGGVLVILGLFLYAKNSGALKALPVGRVAGLAGKAMKAGKVVS